MVNETIKVAVHGALGKMGKAVVEAVSKDSSTDLIAGIDKFSESEFMDFPRDKIPMYNSLEECFSQHDDIEILVDFTNSEGVSIALEVSAKNQVSLVSGSTGYDDSLIDRAENLANNNGIGIVLAPNFAIGAVLLGVVSKIIAPFFDYVDIVESHHEQKLDSPSGTAISLAESISSERKDKFRFTKTESEKILDTRGGDFKGIKIHSVRMPGRVARHEIIFGSPGQTLTLIHDSIDRVNFMPGVLLAVKYASKMHRSKPRKTHMIYGIEKILGL
jgi:4-hydroxy-tetrahydrodipicolinate reductase